MKLSYLFLISQCMKKYEGRFVGILGAIILHLTAGIIFMVVKIGSLNIKEYTREYQIALEEAPPVEVKKTEAGSKPVSVEQILSGDQEMLNIARNMARQPDIKINKEDYIDQVKEELIEKGKLGEDNYIDEQKRLKQESAESPLSLQQDKPEKEKLNKPLTSQEMASKYSGPTRIYYDLPGRTHLYLPLPIYKCEGAGKVVLNIEVNPEGIVTHASVIESESTTNDPCLVETAVSTALISRFNQDINAPRSQKGTLTYHFVAQ
jgi:hypothetical protein